jgi:hypothetical protein
MLAKIIGVYNAEYNGVHVGRTIMVFHRWQINERLRHAEQQ